MSRLSITTSILCFLLIINTTFANTQSIILDTQPFNIELGQYFDDKELSYSFYLSNSGKHTISNIDITTSCGCTNVSYLQNAIEPGQKIKIKVTSDLTGKRGQVVKELSIIYTQNNQQKAKTITITFFVIANIDAHKTRKLGDVLFNKQCGKCHALPAAGKTGKELFKAVCAFCHGENAGGATAMGFTSVSYMKNFNYQRVKQTIEKGTANGTMPGYLKDNGGPLTKEQVDSLMDYFKDIRKDFARFLNR